MISLPRDERNPALRWGQPRRPDRVAGLQGSEGHDHLRRPSRVEGRERQEMQPAREGTRASASAMYSVQRSDWHRTRQYNSLG
jgi:hypothetical protein